jgi:UDP-N-acetylglucosamine 2-epimerase (non-hydrolysing)
MWLDLSFCLILCIKNNGLKKKEKDMKKIILVAGARPNFVKIAPLVKEFKKNRKYFNVLLVHTGQHYDFEMSEIFFQHLDIPEPDVHLNIGSDTHAKQTAKIMMAFEDILIKERPDRVIVVGDVNSTLACSLVASKLCVKVAHVESGLRSFDRSMPEEINRLVTDSISDYLFVSEESGLKNLRKENIPSEKVFFVGNIMIDTLLSNRNKISDSNILQRLSIRPESYAVLTMHRPSNVDSRESLAKIYDILKDISGKIEIIYPIHPRTRKMMEKHGFMSKFESLKGFIIIDSLGYIDFIKLVEKSKFVLTDSGGIQEETTILKIPCLTMRDNTERPVTLTKGTNHLVGSEKRKIVELVEAVLKGKIKQGNVPKFWDGKTAERIVNVLKLK